MSSYVFIDSRVRNYDLLLASLAPDTPVVILDPAQDGIEQIASALEGVTDLDAIHIISHGSEGTLYLGDTVLTSDNLDHYTSELESTGAALTESGDILLYGCEVANGVTGKTFIDNLALYTGADVAASSDLTGSTALNGNWVLEATTGAIETSASLSTEAQSDYSHTLAAGDSIVHVSNTTDLVNGNTSSVTALIANPGADGISLREAFLAVNATSGAHIISFAEGLAGQTISVTTELPVLTRSNVTLQGLISNEGDPTVTIDMSTVIPITGTEVLTVRASEVMISGLRFTGTLDTHTTINIDADANLGIPLVENVTIIDCVFDHTGSDGTADGIRIGPNTRGSINDGLSSGTVRNVHIVRNVFDHFIGHANAIHLQGAETHSAIEDTLILGNTIRNSSFPVELVNIGNDGTLAGTRIIGNTILNSIQAISIGNIGNTDSSSGTPVPAPANNNLIDDTFISGNFISGMTNPAIIIVGGLYYAENNNITNTVIANNVITAGQTPPPPPFGGISFTGGSNGGSNNAINGVLIINNTIVRGAGGGVGIVPNEGTSSGNTVTGLMIVNTIITGIGDDLGGPITAEMVSHSLLSTGTVGVTTYGGVNGNVVGNPLFVNPAEDDFRLQPGSPAIDAGLGTNAPVIDADYLARYDDPAETNTGSGTPPYIDIGAFEFGAGSANDILQGTEFGDHLRGGAGSDSLNGLDGDDLLQGDEGDDVLIGGAGGDSLDGGTGLDTASYMGATQGVTVDLAAANDQATGADIGVDQILKIENVVGGSGGDIILGDESDNVLYGAAGGDTLEGGDGDDTLNGSTGDDRLIGGNGLDWAYYNDAGADVTVNLATITAQNTIGAGTDTLNTIENVLSSIYHDSLTGNGAANQLDGSAGNDNLIGNGGNDTLLGGDGEDTLNGGTGLDTASYAGAASAVTVTLASTAAQNTGGAGSDTLTNLENLTGSSHNDTLTGGTVANLLKGELGHDNLNGGLGNDTLEGGDGDDTLTGSTGDDSLAGGAGLDWAYYNGAGSAVSVNLTTTAAQNTGGAGSDTLTTIEHVLGSNYHDTLTGNSAGNQLDGGAGNDTLDGGTGNDTLKGGSGNDTYIANAAGDVVIENAGAGTDSVQSSVTHTLAANVEHLTLTGTGNASGNGNSLANQLTGNSGNNTLNGGTGNDTMAGGLGNDTYVVNAAGDVVTEAAAAGSDLVQASTSHTLQANVEHLTLTGAGNSSGNGNSLDNLLTGNSKNNALNGGSGNDTMAGGAGNDSYSVNAAGDVVTEGAGAGTDSVSASLSYTLGANVENLTLTGAGNAIGTGNTLNNKITGNSGNNTLIGNSGADTITGGKGADTLTGGTGIDTFDYNALTDATDTITDFTAGAGGDKLDIDTLLTVLGYNGADPIAAGYVQLLQAGAHTQVNIDSNGGGDSFAVTLTTLQNVTAGNVTLVDNFIV
jgi:Ca2+-binding RTX toxin-like protein